MRRNNTYSKKEIDISQQWLNGLITTGEANKKLKLSPGGIYIVIAAAERYRRMKKYEDG